MGRRRDKQRKPKEERQQLKGNAKENLDEREGGEVGPKMPIITADSVYDYYAENLIPAIQASLPFLLHRLKSDIMDWLQVAGRKTAHFLLPHLSGQWPDTNHLLHMMEQAASNSTVSDFLIRHFDTNQDGHISPTELLNMTEILQSLQQSSYPQTWFQWFSRSWPLMDWKIGVFLWRSCGGLLLSIAVLSILPGRLHGYVGKILRWPVLALTYFLIAVELVVYILIRLFIRIIETVFANSKHRALRDCMRKSKAYHEWYQHAMDLDISQGRERWRQIVSDDTSYRYNWTFIKELMRDMRKARKKGDSLLALAVLQQCTHKNVGGIMSEECFSFTNTGEPKYIVCEFVQEVADTLKWVTNEALSTPVESTPLLSKIEQRAYEDKLQTKVQDERNKMWSSVVGWAMSLNHRESTVDNTAIGTTRERNSTGALSAHSEHTPTQSASLPAYHREKVKMFLKRARAAYGRTALVLSGGAMMGNYHFGHVKSLLEIDALPRIISGTSAGSVIGAMVCTRTDEEIKRDMTPEVLEERLMCFSLPWKERIKNLWKKGCMFNYSDWRKLMKWVTCGDLTFEEAYKKSGRVLCITLSAKTKKAPPVLLNYISAPNVVVGSAVIASAAVPGFIEPARLEVKDSDGNISFQGGAEELYWDGSIEQDIPTTGLAEMLNCRFFIAAQCNPHIVPFFYNCRGGVGRPTRWSSGDREDAWRGGFLLSALELYLKSDMKAKFQFLHDIEAAVGFTSTLMTQQYEGSTTIVPQVSFVDYFQLFSNPTKKSLQRYEQAGLVAAYGHGAMIKLHNSIADALEECLKRLETHENNLSSKRVRVVVDVLPSRDRDRVLSQARNVNNVLNSEINSETTWTEDDVEDDDAYYQIESLIPTTNSKDSDGSK